MTRQEAEQVSRFFASLAGATGDVTGRLLEIRAIRAASVKRWFFPSREVPDGVQRVCAVAGNHNLYFGAHLRDSAASDTDAVPEANCVFVDIDRLEQAQEAFRRLDRFRPLPAHIVWTGNGVHAYWPLTRPLPLRTGSEREQYRSIQRRLARCFDADISVSDPSRILRMPYTWNHKYAPPRQCRFLRQEGDVRFELEEILAGLPEILENPRRPYEARLRAAQEPADREDNAACLLAHCQRIARRPIPEGERNRRLCQWAVYLREETPFDAGTIRTLLRERARNSMGTHPVTDEELERIFRWARV